VCVGGAVEEWEVLDSLTALTDKSLVLAEEEQEGHTRYRLLETVRQYARERLASDEAGEVYRQQHAAYFLELATTAEPHLSGSDAKVWRERLQAEQENLRAAFEWALQQEPLTALRLAHQLYVFWVFLGQVKQGGEWLERSLATAPDAPPSDLCRALQCLAMKCRTYNETLGWRKSQSGCYS
jgi:predicted ATPase